MSTRSLVPAAVAVMAAAWLVSVPVLAAPAASAATKPGLTLAPTQGPPNSVASFRGSGFCSRSSCGRVTITFAGQVAATDVRVASGGGISGSVRVPAVPAGWQRVVATQPGSGRSATALFFVGPSLPGSTGPVPTVTPVAPSATVSIEPSRTPASDVPSPTTTTATPSPSGTTPPGTTSAPSGTPTGTSATNEAAAEPAGASTSASAWPWVVALVVLLSGAAVALVRRSR